MVTNNFWTPYKNFKTKTWNLKLGLLLYFEKKAEEN